MEHTFLLHVPAPGAPAKVLYWYRTAPGLRVGRAALDDSAMRTIEDTYPEIDFDWPYILDMGAMTPVEVEAPVPPRPRKIVPASRADSDVADEGAPRIESSRPAAADPEPAAPVRPSPVGDLLSELLGRGIATSLRALCADVRAMVEASPAESSVKDGWRGRLAALDPDGWLTPEAVLAGMPTAEPLLLALRGEVQPPAEG